MAKKQSKKGTKGKAQTTTSTTETNLTPKGMVKDADESYISKQNWNHARNAINNSIDGDVGVIGNEPANLKCSEIPYPVIGGIHLYGDKWIIFSTNDIESEIGSFDDSQCKYVRIVNDRCLNFNRKYLVIGAAKENYDCTWQIYWDDGNNPSRTLNLDEIPWYQHVTSPVGAACVTYENDDPLVIDCERLRLAPLIDVPCITISKADEGGMLKNGSYQAYIAYSIDEQVIGDYIGYSNLQSVWTHGNSEGSLLIQLTNLDRTFDYYQLVLRTRINGQTKSYIMGYYSSEQTIINIGYIDAALSNIPDTVLLNQSPTYEKSEGMYVVNDYLIRSQPTEQFDFNYQPKANNITTDWVSVRYPANYYYNGGHNPTFMRDEQYSFFIRFVYNTGEKSKHSYHIPGRDFLLPAEYALPPNLDNRLNCGENAYWQTVNTADAYGPLAQPYNLTEDGGEIIAKGRMGYWQSSELYPNDPARWNNGSIDLCGLPIRHHKFPDETSALATQLYDPPDSDMFESTAGLNRDYIYVLGVEFGNIAPPTFNDGTLIPNIVGYEILVGSREGHKSIIAKGIIRNMMTYEPESHDNTCSSGSGPRVTTATDPAGNQVPIPWGLFANYPYNDLNKDPYLIYRDRGNQASATQNWFSSTGPWGIPGPNAGIEDNWITGDSTHANQPGDTRGMDEYTRDYFTFHSPDTNFFHYYLAPSELRIYNSYNGLALGNFKKSEDHPGAKLLENRVIVIAAIMGVGYAIYRLRGKQNQTVEGSSSHATGEYWMEGSFLGSGAAGGGAPITGTGTAFAAANIAAHETAPATSYWTQFGMDGAVDLLSAVGGGRVARHLGIWGYQAAEVGITALVAGHVGPRKKYSWEGSEFTSIPTPMAVVTGIYNFLNYIAIGGQKMIDLILNLCSFQDFVYKYNSHGFYHQGLNSYGMIFSPHNGFSGAVIPPSFAVPGGGTPWRRKIDKARYIKGAIQNFDGEIKVQNLHRQSTVVVHTHANVDPCPTTGMPQQVQATNTFLQPDGSTMLDYGPIGDPLQPDYSKFTIGDAGCWTNPSFGGRQTVSWFTPTAQVESIISAHYVGLKVDIPNQYGQLDGIRQLPTHNCYYFRDQQSVDVDGNLIPIDPDLDRFDTTASVIFGGDCYVARYTEKTTMPFFWNFLKEGEDGLPFDYKLYANVPFPRYWLDSAKYRMDEFIKPVTDLTFNWSGHFPNDMYQLDMPTSITCPPAMIINFNSIGSNTGVFNAGTALQANYPDFMVTNDPTVAPPTVCAANPNAGDYYYEQYTIETLPALSVTITANCFNPLQDEWTFQIELQDITITHNAVTYIDVTGATVTIPADTRTIGGMINGKADHNWHQLASGTGFSLDSISLENSPQCFGSSQNFAGCSWNFMSQSEPWWAFPPCGQTYILGELTGGGPQSTLNAPGLMGIGSTLRVLYDWNNGQIVRIIRDGAPLSAGAGLLPNSTQNWVDDPLNLDTCVNTDFTGTPNVSSSFQLWNSQMTIFNPGGSPGYVFVRLAQNAFSINRMDVVPTPWPLGNFNPNHTVTDLQITLNTPPNLGTLTANMSSAYSYDADESGGLFVVTGGYMYVHNSGVQDFYVETDINLAYRDWEDVPRKRHYDEQEYTDTVEMFDAQHITSDNYYKYDKSVGVRRFLNSSFASLQPRYYDPLVAETCWTHYPKRLIYSLNATGRQKTGQGDIQKYIGEGAIARKDFWRAFLKQNYRDFKSKINVIKPMSKSGAIMLFPTLSPQLFQGLDVFKPDKMGMKMVIGDGGLFGQPFQNVANSDLSHEYGSCESSRSALNTPHGLYFISQAQGKIFNYSGKGIENIANTGLKYWFNEYLPSRLLSFYPEIEDCPKVIDNPVAGIGCQTVYDPNYNIVYFSKRDYEPIGDPECISYVPCEGFQYNTTLCGTASQTIICPSGYTYNTTTSQCEKTFIAPCIEIPSGEEQWQMAIASSSNIEDVNPIQDVTYGSDCPIIIDTYDPNTGVALTGSYLSNSFWKNMPAPNASTGIVNYLSHSSTLGGLKFGLQFKMYSSVSRTVYVLIAANNEFEIIQDPCPQIEPDDLIIQSDSEAMDTDIWTYQNGCTTNINATTGGVFTTPGVSTYMRASLYPINIPVGHSELSFNFVDVNIVETMLALSIIDNTKLEIDNATSYGDLTVLYDTSNLQKENIVTEFVLPEIWECPAGFDTITVPVNWTSIIHTTDSHCDVIQTAWSGQSSLPYNAATVYMPGDAVQYVDPYYGTVNYYIASVQSGVITGGAGFSNKPPVAPNVCCYGGGCTCPPAYMNDYYWEGCGWNMTGGSNNSAQCPSCEDTSVTTICECNSDCSDDGYGEIITLSSGEEACEYLDCVPPDIEDTYIPIELSNDTYFKDISWTVSYDPKSKAWISFHDWHPELTFNSINHFMTTQTETVTTPICPPGYYFNQTTQECCIEVYWDTPAVINYDAINADVDVVPAIVTAFGESMDIAIVIDDSCSVCRAVGQNNCQNVISTFPTVLTPCIDATFPNTVLQAQLNFANAFLVGMGDGMLGGAAGTDNVTIGHGLWGTSNSLIQPLNGTEATVAASLVEANYPGMQQGTSYQSGINLANTILAAGTGTKKIALVITDSASNVCGSISGNFTAGTDVYVVFSTVAPLQGCAPPPNGWDHIQCLISNATNPAQTPVCNNGVNLNPNLFEVNASNWLDVAADIIASITDCDCPAGYSSVPNTNPCLPAPAPAPECILCQCPPGYVLDGVCNNQTTPVCKKIDCECTPIPHPLATFTTTGTCPDVYTYPLNPDPLICHWYYQDCVDPNYTVGGIWKHNFRTDKYANYYGVDYPWEVDLIESSGQSVATIRSIEYQLESFVYKNHGMSDRWQDLNWNFDESIIYNTEQVSGLLVLDLSPVNNIPLLVSYPIINPTDIQILYSKEEQKYRFNQFWDITNDRGEFSGVELPIFITQLNGYIRDLNAANLNYNKPALQRKKFRHYNNHVVLRRTVSSDRKMLLRLMNTKINLSPR
jgi:hypothetical protein